MKASGENGNGVKESKAGANSPQMFHFDGRPVRVIVLNGETWWAAKDLSQILGYSPSNMKQTLKNLEDSEKGRYQISTPGGTQKIWMVNEPGLYSLILGSQKLEAKKFKRWVTSEVLPSIRKTGGYVIPKHVRLIEHTYPDVQKFNSVGVNRKNGNEGGKWAAMCYNLKSFHALTGNTPSEAKERAIENKYPIPKNFLTGKEVLRYENPPMACALSLRDDLVMHGVNFGDTHPIVEESLKVFGMMLSAGVKPRELIHE